MAGIMKRAGGAGCWIAIIRAHGKEIRKSTEIPINPPPSYGLTPKQAEKLAREKAEKMELAARGESNAAAASLRAMAQAIEDAAGGTARISTRAYLDAVDVGGKDKARADSRRTFAEFIAWLDTAPADHTANAGADMPVAALNWKTCLAFLGHLIGQGLALSTVGLKRGHLSTAWRKAVRDDIASKNPWEFATMAEARRMYAPDQRAGRKSDRAPFTMEEMKRILTTFPPPWQDVAALSFYTGGQRLGDCCALTWQAVDLPRAEIHMETQKTGLPLVIPIHPALMPRLQRLHAAAPAGSVYVFPDLAAVMGADKNTAPLASTFTAMLKACGIIPAHTPRKAGRGHNMPAKSFHSIRHTVTTALAAAGVPEAVGMAVVGHENKDVHAAYVTIGQDAKRDALQVLPYFTE